MLEEYPAATKLVESVDEWEVKEVGGQVMEVVEAETGRGQEARGQDQGLDPVDENIASCLFSDNQPSS